MGNKILRTIWLLLCSLMFFGGTIYCIENIVFLLPYLEGIETWNHRFLAAYFMSLVAIIGTSVIYKKNKKQE